MWQSGKFWWNISGWLGFPLWTTSYDMQSTLSTGGSNLWERIRSKLYSTGGPCLPKITKHDPNPDNEGLNL